MNDGAEVIGVCPLETPFMDLSDLEQTIDISGFESVGGDNSVLGLAEEGTILGTDQNETVFLETNAACPPEGSQEYNNLQAGLDSLYDQRTAIKLGSP